jgi:hypothetical protein
MVELRGGNPLSTDALRKIASMLSGYSDTIVGAACDELERAEVDPYNKVPSLETIVSVCRRAAQADITEKRRWCGRCFEGVIRSGKPKGDIDEFIYCPCRCALCDNTLRMTVVKATGQIYDSRVDWKQPRHTVPCPTCSKAA